MLKVCYNIRMISENFEAKPFLKWAGGKSQLLEEIRTYYPQTIEKYCEPFVGGGAVLFDVLSNFSPKEVLINDINGELTNCYIQIRDNVEPLLELFSNWQTEYQNTTEEKRKANFYEKRNRFNELILGVPAKAVGCSALRSRSSSALTSFACGGLLRRCSIA